MKRYSSTNSMNAKVVGITLVSYALWVIFGLILIILANGFSYGNIHVAPMVIQFVSLIFYMLFVMARLYRQWRTRTVEKADNTILLVGLLLFCGTAFTFSRIILVPSGYLDVYQVIFEGGFWSTAAMLVLALIAIYRLKKATTTDQPTLGAQKLLKFTVGLYIITLLLEFTLISIVYSDPFFSNDVVYVILGINGLYVAYGVIDATKLLKQRRTHTLAVWENNILQAGALVFAISPILMEIIAGLVGIYMVYGSFFSISHVCLILGGVGLLVFTFLMVRQIKKQSGTAPQIVAAQPAEVKQQQGEEQRRQVEAKARKQAEAEVKQRLKVDAEVKQNAKDEEKRRQAEEKAKRKAEEEARKRAEADEKARRKAEQDAQKKAEYEAEMRRRAEAEAKAKADAEAKLRAEEDAKMKKLQQLVKVSDRLSVARMAQLLEMPAEEVWKHVPDWAEKFNFRIAGEELVFNKDTMDDFIASLDKEFRKWGKDGKI